MSRSKVSQKIGSGLAHVQSFVDDVVAFGFGKLSELGRKERGGFFRKKPKTAGEKAMHALKKSAGFVGEVGQSFYEKYEEIKAEKLERDE